MMNVSKKICGEDGVSVTTSALLPRVIRQDEEFQFALDDRNGYHLLFVTKEMLGKSRPFTPLWALPCRDAAAAKVFSRWLAVRRNQWANWAKMAQTMTPLDFDTYMGELLAAEVLMEVESTMLRQYPDGYELAFSHVFEWGRDIRVEEVVRHKFGSRQAYEGFVDWLNTGNNMLAIEALVQIAFSEGTDAFGEALDRLATTKPITRHQRRARERGRSPH